MPHIHEAIDFTVGALIVYAGRVCLVNHRELKIWLAPGGHVELGEDTDQALFREIDEETGFTARDLEILSEKPEFPDERRPGFRSLYAPRWMNIHPISATHRHIVLVYVFRAKHDRLRLAEREHHDIRWFTSGELQDPNLTIPGELRWCAAEAIRIAS